MSFDRLAFTKKKCNIFAQDRHLLPTKFHQNPTKGSSQTTMIWMEVPLLNVEENIARGNSPSKQFCFVKYDDSMLITTFLYICLNTIGTLLEECFHISSVLFGPNLNFAMWKSLLQISVLSLLRRKKTELR